MRTEMVLLGIPPSRTSSNPAHPVDILSLISVRRPFLQSNELFNCANEQLFAEGFDKKSIGSRPSRPIFGIQMAEDEYEDLGRCRV